MRELAGRVRCPPLVVHGTATRSAPQLGCRAGGDHGREACLAPEGGPRPRGPVPGEGQSSDPGVRGVARRAMSTLVRERTASPTEPSRARYPDETGFAEREGVRLYWERYGDGAPTFLFLAPTPISQSRAWKAQIPYLARHHRVVVYDCRGNGEVRSPARRRCLPHGGDGARRARRHGRHRHRARRPSRALSRRARTAVACRQPPRPRRRRRLHRALPAGDPLATRSRPCARRTWSRGRGACDADDPRHDQGDVAQRSITVLAPFLTPRQFLEGLRKFNGPYWLQDQRGLSRVELRPSST